MFEKFVLGKIDIENNILQQLIESIPEEETISKKIILTSDLSDFTKNYLMFDYSEKEGFEELSSKISRSNKLYFNYTIRPRWTLQTFLFNNFESRPPNDILKKINLFTFYSFYTEAIKGFIADNSQIFITKNEVTSIIDHTNKAIYEKLISGISNAKIKNFFLQIFILKYDSESNFNLESTVPYSFVKIFLDDKSFSDLEKKFSSVKGITGETELSLKDIIKILTDKYHLQEMIPHISKTDATKDSPAKLAPLNDMKKETEPIREKLKEDDIIISGVKEIDLKKDEVKKKSTDYPGLNENDVVTENIKQQDVPEKTHSARLVNTDKKIKEPVSVQNEETIIPKEDDKLKGLFSEKQLEKILSKVYRSDLIYREKSFDNLRAYKTWSEASAHLKDLFKVNNVDLYNKDVVTFVNILNDYYKNKE
ncbi:MAG: hypothetical protein IPL53_02260 [Ignavibacteria bacterium]|nr:hypothetical protein [Ignavibacteria bacterium]